MPCSQQTCVGDIVFNLSSVSDSFEDKSFVLPISKMPQNSFAFNVELSPSQGGKVARAAGSYVSLQGVDLSNKTSFLSNKVVVRLPSGVLKTLSAECLGLVGSNSNENHKYESLGKAGRRRLLGRRPKVRGVAMNPVDHPMGGGEGKASGGRPSVSPQGWHTKGRRTVNKRKLSKGFF